MKSKIFLQLIIFCFVSFADVALCAEKISQQEAESWTYQKGKDLLDTFALQDISVKYAKLDEMFLNDIDLDYIGKFVIGKYWRQMTKEQQERYMPLFKRYSLSLYKGFPLNFDFDINFKVASVKTEKNYTDINTLITLDGEVSDAQKQNSFLVSFRVHKVDGRIKIIDLKLGESSLILSYRGRFYEMIKELDDEIEWFLEDLETVTASAEKQNQMNLGEQNL